MEESDQPINPRYLGEISGRIKSVIEIQDLPFEAILAFYRKDEDATETDQANIV